MENSNDSNPYQNLFGISDSVMKYFESSLNARKLFADSPLVETAMKIQEMSEAMRHAFDSPVLDSIRKMHVHNETVFADLRKHFELFPVPDYSSIAPIFRDLNYMNDALGELLGNEHEEYRSRLVTKDVYVQLNELAETLPHIQNQNEEIDSNASLETSDEDAQETPKLTVGQVIMFLLALIQTFYPVFSDYQSNVQDSEREVIEDKQHSELMEKMDVLINSIQSQAVRDEVEVDPVGPHSQ
ncbi:hypothetical protein [Priestia megaterium]|uniref:hypothetical protein n=1 Tax=Priestia megaterium TaxID=1404 RepID=UPI003D00EDB6